MTNAKKNVLNVIFSDYRITDLLKGKGAFKNGKFQGKAGDLGGINKCKKLVEDYFNNTNT